MYVLILVLPRKDGRTITLGYASTSKEKLKAERDRFSENWHWRLYRAGDGWCDGSPNAHEYIQEIGQIKVGIIL